MKKINLIIRFLILFIVVEYMVLLCQCTNQSHGGCREVERKALLKFKRSFVAPGPILSSWEGMNCCEWDGVGCDSKTGYVLKLDLRSICYTPSFIVSYKNTMTFEGDIPFVLEASKLDSSLLQLKYLSYLDLSGNSFNGSELPQFLGEMNGIEYLNLSQANFKRDLFPPQLGNLTNLQVLDVSYIHRSNEGTFFSVGQTFEWLSTLSSLKGLYMGGVNLNRVHNLLPMLNTLPSLSVLSLSECQLDDAQFSPTYSNLTFLSSVQELYLRRNYFVGPPVLLKNMSSLRVLDLSDSSFVNWSIPIWLTDLKDLEYLANITGPWPKWLSSSLGALNLSHNQISGNIPHNIADLFPGLQHLILSINLLNGTIPSSFCEMKYLAELDISRNMLSGNIPNCWEDNHIMELETLKLSFNKLTGVIPSSIGNLSGLQWLHFDNNRLTGDILSSLRNCKLLVVLNLGDNGFSGNIPSWMGIEMSMMQALVLRNNGFDGYIPRELCQMESLRILDLAHNNFTGNIPHCLGSLTAMTMKHSLDMNNISGVGVWYYEWEEEYLALTIKRLKLGYTSLLPIIVVMDLSSNHLIGEIPQELMLLSQLLSLNLSHNHLTGTIPENIGNLMALESLDLANNQLSGNIPIGMSLLQSLSSLNLSHNNFSGRIPTGNQLQALPDPSIYDGNPNLCGFPLTQSCPGDERPHVSISSKEENDEENKSYKIWLYLAITIGYGVGLWAFFGTLMLKKKWRYAYFRYVDYTIDWIYVFIVVNARRLKRKMMGVEE